MIYSVVEDFSFDAWEKELSDTRKAGAVATPQAVFEILKKGNLTKPKLVAAIKGEVGCEKSAAYAAIARAESKKFNLIFRSKVSDEYTACKK